MPHVELQYGLTGKALPSDHGYALFSAISHLVPEIHAADWLAIETVAGTARGDGLTQLDKHARLRVRLPQERVPLLLKLAGQRLDVAGHAVRLGAPQIYLLRPSSALYSRIVVIKGYTEPEPLLDAVCRKLQELGVQGEPVVGPRRVLKVGTHTIVGFAVAARELSDDASILLQERGLGGRRRMGCGIFNPITRPAFGNEEKQ